MQPTHVFMTFMCPINGNPAMTLHPNLDAHTSYHACLADARENWMVKNAGLSKYFTEEYLPDPSNDLVNLSAYITPDYQWCVSISRHEII